MCFAFQDLETEFWMAGHKAITETLAAQGHTVIEQNSNEDANKQLEQVKNCIAQGVDAIMVIPVDGSIALTLIAEANTADIPIGIFNRPPQSEDGNALTVVANNEAIAEQAVEYMAQEAKKLGAKVTPLIMVGDLGDPNAVGRYDGFYNVIDKYPDLFNEPIEVATKWDAADGAGRPAGSHDGQPGRQLPLHLLRLPVSHHPGHPRAHGQVGPDRAIPTTSSWAASTATRPPASS